MIDDFDLEWDEDGLILTLMDSNGGEHRFNVSAVAERLYDKTKAVIGPWIYEQALAQAEFKQRTRGGETWNPETKEWETAVADERSDLREALGS